MSLVKKGGRSSSSATTARSSKVTLPPGENENSPPLQTVQKRKCPNWIDANHAEVWANDNGDLRIVESIQLTELLSIGKARLWWYHHSPYEPDCRWVYEYLFTNSEYRRAMQDFELVEVFE